MFNKIILEFENIFFTLIKFFPGVIGKLLRRFYLGIFINLGKSFICEPGLTVKNYKNIKINSNCKIGFNNFLIASDGGFIKIGKNFATSNNVTINASNNGIINIGDNVLIAPNVVIRASDHIHENKDININQSGHKSGTITIENNVWIGANSVILKNVKISNGSIIGAGSVITKNVPENVIVLNNKQMILKKRFE